MLNTRKNHANTLDMLAMTINLTEHNDGGLPCPSRLPRAAIKEKKEMKLPQNDLANYNS